MTASAAEGPADVYHELNAGTSVAFAGQTIELKKGRFTIRRFNDVAGDNAGTESGTYRRFGVRLVFLSDAPDFVEAEIEKETGGKK